MHGKGFKVRHAPAHAGRGELEGRKLGVKRDFARRKMPPDFGPDGKPERVSGGQHHNPLALARFQLVNQRVKRRRPAQRFRRRVGRQHMVPRPADNHFSGLDHSAGGGG